MDQLTGMLNEMYESGNMVKFLKTQFNVDNKMPVEVSSALKSIRVTQALQARHSKFMNDNLTLSTYQLWSRHDLRELNKALSLLNSKFNEDDEANLSNEQKKLLVKYIQRIEAGILNVAGRITVELEAKGLVNELTAEQRMFSDEAKAFYEAVQEENDRKGHLHQKAIDKEVALEEIEEQEELENGFTLSSVPNKEESPKPKQVITPDIDI